MVGAVACLRSRARQAPRLAACVDVLQSVCRLLLFLGFKPFRVYTLNPKPFPARVKTASEPAATEQNLSLDIYMYRALGADRSCCGIYHARQHNCKRLLKAAFRWLHAALAHCASMQAGHVVCPTAGLLNICPSHDVCAGLWPGDKSIARRVLWALAGPLASQQAARDLQEASSHEQALQALSRSRDGLSQLGKLCSFVFEPASQAQVGALRCPPMLSHQKLGVRDAASTRALQRPHLSLCTHIGPCQVVIIWDCPAEGTHSRAGACLAATCAAPLAESQTHPGVPA